MKREICKPSFPKHMAAFMPVLRLFSACVVFEDNPPNLSKLFPPGKSTISRISIHGKVTLPSDRLFDVLTVRCGHCASIFPVHLASMFQPFPSQDFQGYNVGGIKNYQMDFGSSSQDESSLISSTKNDERQNVPVPPPEKRHRLPSAYNKFIKEEIQRLKANNPNISHKQAFSTAAKNWAHLPHGIPDNDERLKLEELMASPGDLKS